MRKRSKNYNVISLSLLLGLLCSFIFPGLSSYADSCREKIYEKEKNDLSSQNLLFGSVKLYRKYLSSLFGGNCSLNPSCSNYSLHAFGEDGLLLGFLLTYDRLIHESDEYKFSYKINVDDK